MATKSSIKYFKIFSGILIISLMWHFFLRSKIEPMEHSEVLHRGENTDFDKNPTDLLFPNRDFKPVFLQSGFKREEYESDGIPKIIHQIWDTYEVPDRFSVWMKTWKHINPSWEHWFWSLDDARALIEKQYSSYLSLFDAYPLNIFRADMARYFIIHQYGGVYADLDMSSIRPLENWTIAYDCIVSEEPYEHTYVVRDEGDVSILNGFIACKKQHPFLEATIASLEDAASKYFGDYLKATGPVFFTDSYMKWRRKFKRTSSDVLDLIVVPPKYFFPTYDKSESDTLSAKCHPSTLGQLPQKMQLICKELIFRSYSNEATREGAAYADHDWLHSYMFGDDFKTKNTQDVRLIVPGVMLASGLI